MKRTIAALILAAGLAACGAPERQGDPAVHAAIEQESDCAKLQERFDWAANMHDKFGGAEHTSYMDTAMARMEEVNC
jgi:hypothetical protein